MGVGVGLKRGGEDGGVGMVHEGTGRGDLDERRVLGGDRWFLLWRGWRLGIAGNGEGRGGEREAGIRTYGFRAPQSSCLLPLRGGKDGRISGCNYFASGRVGWWQWQWQWR